MSRGSYKGNVIIEEEEDDNDDDDDEELNRTVKSINIESKIVVEEGFYDEEDEEASNMSMVVDGDDDKPSNQQQQKHQQFKQRQQQQQQQQQHQHESVDGQEALDLSFIPCSIPLKKRKISSLPYSNEDKASNKSDHHRHRHVVTKDTSPSSAFNQLTDNQQLNSYNFQQQSNNHFTFAGSKKGLGPPFEVSPSSCVTSSPSSKPLSLVKQQQQQQQHQQHQDLGNKASSTGLLASPTSGQAKGMSCRRPGFITCSICNATKYYSHVQRRFGQYSCEPCSKFMKRFLRDPKIFTCSHKGHCTIGKPSGEQEPRGVSVNRCKACWLKICLEKFILDSGTRLVIDKYYAPKFDDTGDNSMSTTSSSTSLSDRMETNGCDTILSLPPLPFPQRKRKPKSETVTTNQISSSSQNDQKTIPLPTNRKDGTLIINDGRASEKLYNRGDPFTSTLLSEPLCLTTSSRADGGGLRRFGNNTSNINNSSNNNNSSNTFSNSNSPRYPWKRGKEEDFDMMGFRRGGDVLGQYCKLPVVTHVKSHDVICRDDDLSDLYTGDYTANTTTMKSNPGKDNDGREDEDEGGDEPQCGKCSYCLPKIDEKANVVVVKESCKYVRCRLAEMMRSAKMNNSSDGSARNHTTSTNNTTSEGDEDDEEGSSSRSAGDGNGSGGGRRNAEDEGAGACEPCDEDEQKPTESLRHHRETGNPNEVKNGAQHESDKRKVMFNKPLKKLLITEHFINTTKRDLDDEPVVISSDSNFLNEILNANSPFL